VRFEAGDNESGRRLDRVLKKLLKGAPLSFVYRVIRKDVKVNGKRVPAETLLKTGDVVEIFLPEEQIEEAFRGRPAKELGAKKQFSVVYEDENVLVVNKPFGLLTHGAAAERKNTLANQVAAYLLTKEVRAPGGADVFTPAPANRLDRNTTGLVVFGKTLPAARDLAAMLHGGEEGSSYVEKAYLAVVKGRFAEPLTLKARMTRDDGTNTTKVLHGASEEGRVMATEALPVSAGKGYTLVEARLLTGRTHQIRAQLAAAGFPVVGDRKYGDADVNRIMTQKYKLHAQLLHAYKLSVFDGVRSLEYLKGKTFTAAPPVRFKEIAEDLGCGMKKK